VSTNPIPTEIQLHKASRVLEVAFDTGERFQLPCEYLRVYSPSAEVLGRHEGESKLQLGKENVSITDIQPVGNYSVKLFFDDGHRSGLYDWSYLYHLGREQDRLWSEYLERLAASGHRRRVPEG
jgi:DUF971 family protein